MSIKKSNFYTVKVPKKAAKKFVKNVAQKKLRSLQNVRGGNYQLPVKAHTSSNAKAALLITLLSSTLAVVAVSVLIAKDLKRRNDIPLWDGTKDVVEDVKAKASEVKDQVADKVEDVKKEAAETKEQASDKTAVAKDKVAAAKETASSKAADAKAKAAAAKNEAAAKTDELKAEAKENIAETAEEAGAV